MRATADSRSGAGPRERSPIQNFGSSARFSKPRAVPSSARIPAAMKAIQGMRKEKRPQMTMPPPRVSAPVRKPRDSGLSSVWKAAIPIATMESPLKKS